MGAFAKTIPAYQPKNTSLFSNRFGLDLNAKATQDISVSAHLNMYKVFGSQNDSAITNSGSAPFFADRVGVFDGTLGHVPSTSYLNVDRVYATWSNIADREMWFSVGRRPSTGGAPSNLRTNNVERPGNGGTPALLVDYAFDGVTLGYAPEIDALPGAYAKFCDLYDSKMQFCASSFCQIQFNVKELKNRSNSPGSEGVPPSCTEGKMPSLPGFFHYLGWLTMP